MTEIRPEWADEKYVSVYASIPVETLRGWRKRGTGPQFSKVGARSVRYRLSDVDAYFESCRSTPAAS